MPKTSTSKARTFHHGNLRQELIEAGHAALHEHGVEGLSLRKLAQRAGVSQSAPYRHFETKEALLQELIDGGLQELTLAYEAAANLTASPSEKLRAACNGYLDFAANRAGLFQLIFEGDGSFSPTSVQSIDDSPSFILFIEMVTDAAPTIPKGKEVDAATLVWSIIHGFATLFSHDKLPKGVDPSWLRNVALDTAIASVSDL